VNGQSLFLVELLLLNLYTFVHCRLQDDCGNQDNRMAVTGSFGRTSGGRRGTCRAATGSGARRCGCCATGTVAAISSMFTERGFVYDGVSYRSVSAIGRRITGAHWSGPRSFAL
jgi:hypothetical protein